MAIQNSNRHDFSNKIVLVTGGTGALGRSITKAFLESNATVISSYLNDRETGKTNNKSSIQLVKANVTNEEEIKKLVLGVLDKYGRIDILVNVVGAYLGGKTVVELEEKEWDLMMNVNCIMPSIIDTEANRKAMPNADFNKWVKPEELSNVVLFLSSEQAKTITGAAITT